MISKPFVYRTAAPLVLFVVAAWLHIVPLNTRAQGQAAHPPIAQGPKAFATPQQAAEELIKAAADYNVPELMAIFGPDGEDFVSSADPVRDKNNAAAFAQEARAAHSVTIDPSNPNRATIIVGQQEWPLPVPLVNKNGKWYFDAKSGRQEILFRRIGANELDAIQVCRVFVEAQ